MICCVTEQCTLLIHKSLLRLFLSTKYSLKKKTLIYHSTYMLRSSGKIKEGLFVSLEGPAKHLRVLIRSFIRLHCWTSAV